MLHAQDLEDVVLGAVLVDESAYHKVVPIIHDPDVFMDDTNAKIWKCIKKLADSSSKIDILTVIQKAKELGYYDHDRGLSAAYIAGLTNKVASGANIIAHALIVKDKWYARQCISLMSVAQKDLIEGANAEDTISNFVSNLRKLSSDEQTGAQRIDSVFSDLMTKARKSSERKDGTLTGIPFTGVKAMDEMFDGREPGDLIFIAAGAKMGKSSTQTNILHYSLENSIPTFAASAEMQNPRILARVLARMADYSTKKVERGDFFSDAKILERINILEEKIMNAPIWLSDGSLSLHKSISAIHHYYNNHSVDLFLFDRVGLFDEVVQARPGQEHKNREMVSAQLRKTANELGVTIIVYSQLTKEYLKEDGGRPQGHHIFGGIGGPANCTKAALIYRPEAAGFDKDGNKYTTFPNGPFEGQDCTNRAEIFTVYNNSDELRHKLVGFNPYSQSFYDLDEYDVRDEDDFSVENPIIKIDGVAKGIDNNDLPF